MFCFFQLFNSFFNVFVKLLLILNHIKDFFNRVIRCIRKYFTYFFPMLISVCIQFSLDSIIQHNSNVY